MTMQPGDELLGFWPLASIALFALNNFILKRALSNVVTGKLSDIACCFFLPLFVSATLGFAGWTAPMFRRVAVGAGVAVLVFVLVKTSPWASDALNTAIGALTGGRATPNRVDASDLVAIPFALVAVAYARRREEAR
jgi:hypothetical protein